jgi:hypothetical protein
MLMKGMKFFCERVQFGRGVRIYLEQETGNDTVARAGPVRLAVFPASYAETVQVDPLMEVDLTSAQQLMDELWHCGLRPSEGTGSAGSLAATERHLADMRTVAFKLLSEEQWLANQARERGFPVELKP